MQTLFGLASSRTPGNDPAVAGTKVAFATCLRPKSDGSMRHAALSNHLGTDWFAGFRVHCSRRRTHNPVGVYRGRALAST
jgi:hypothetical protein